MKLTITNITCNATVSLAQDDNVFLIIQADAGPPLRYPTLGSVKMGAGDTMTLPDGGYTVDFDYGVVITAWDRDGYIFKNVDSPDFIFSLGVNTWSTLGTTTVSKYNHNDFNTTDASYSITQNISSS